MTILQDYLSPHALAKIYGELQMQEQEQGGLRFATTGRRSLAYLQAGKPEAALNDTNQCLRLDPRFTNVNILKCCLYSCNLTPSQRGKEELKECLPGAACESANDQEVLHHDACELPDPDLTFVSGTEFKFEDRTNECSLVGCKRESISSASFFQERSFRPKMQESKLGSSLFNELVHACISGDVQTAEEMITKSRDLLFERDELEWNILHVACFYGNSELVDFILQQAGSKVLSEKVAGGGSALHIASENNNLQVVKRLLEEGGESLLFEEDEMNQTALHVASRVGNCEIAEHFLTRAGRELLIVQDAKNRTAMHYAAARGDEGLCRSFIGCGGSSILEMKDYKGRTCLHVAAQFGRTALLEFLVHAGQGSGIRKRTDRGSNLLHVAAVHGHVDTLNKVLELGSREMLFERNADEWTPLHAAAYNGRDGAVSYLCQVGGKKLLFEPTAEGGTALHLACAANQLVVAETLITFGHKQLLEKRDGEGWSVLQVARAHKNRRIEAFLTNMQVVLHK
eukprot:758496-Hanusia_phi.AAC.7